VLWIYGLRAMLLVQGRGEIAVLPAVTAVLLHPSTSILTVGYIDIDISVNCNGVVTRCQ